MTFLSSSFQRLSLAYGAAVFLLTSAGTGFHAHPRPQAPDPHHLSSKLRLPASGTSFVPPTLKHPKLTTLLAEIAESVPQSPPPPIPSLLPPKVSRSYQVGASAQLPKAVQDALRSHLMQMDSTGAVQVYVELTAVNPQNLQKLHAAGVILEIEDPEHKRVQARVPQGRVSQLESLPFVLFVRLPHYAVHSTGSVDTQGDTILDAQQARSQLHIDGTGVRVGVISDGIKGIFATGCTTCQGVQGGPISTGDLPQSNGTRNSQGVLTSSSGGITGRSFQSNGDLEGLPTGPCGFAGAGAEGTALLEIVFDIAPGAQLLFDNAATDMEFNQAVNNLAGKADIVMDDISFFGLPYDGTSVVSQNTAAALNSESNPIRAYFTAAGNNARQHYLGLYQDSGIDGTTLGLPAGDLHLFQASSATSDILNLGPTTTDRVILPNNGEVVVALTWDDPSGGSANNYDLYFINETTGKVAASSTDLQNGTQDPVEFIDYTNNTGAQSNFGIVIQNVNNKAQPKHLSLFLFQPECAAAGPLAIAPGHTELHNYNTLSSSLAAEADAGGSPASVIAVGAIAANDPGHKDIEFFSSIGPTLDGRVKPDVTGVDGVSITGAGKFENPFYGTSAATPHAAGIAALLLQAAPCLLANSKGARAEAEARTTLHSLVLRNSQALDSPVPNDIFGYGRLNALAAADQTVPTAGAVSAETVSGNSPTGFNGSLPATGFTDPQQCPLTVTSAGGCTASTSASPTVNCPFGTNSVTLTATADAVTFSTPVKTEITVTNFSMSASPSNVSVSAGQPAAYQLTIKPLLGPFENAISLACTGLPARATCNFTPNMVTPNSQPASVQLSISTAAASRLTPGLYVLSRRMFPGSSIRIFGLTLFTLLLFLSLSVVRPTRVGRFTRHVALALVLAYLAVLPACGGGSGGNPLGGNLGTPAGAYTVKVTGIAGSLIVTSSVTLTVQ